MPESELNLMAPIASAEESLLNDSTTLESHESSPERDQAILSGLLLDTFQRSCSADSMCRALAGLRHWLQARFDIGNGVCLAQSELKTDGAVSNRLTVGSACLILIGGFSHICNLIDTESSSNPKVSEARSDLSKIINLLEISREELDAAITEYTKKQVTDAESSVLSKHPTNSTDPQNNFLSAMSRLGTLKIELDHVRNQLV